MKSSKIQLFICLILFAVVNLLTYHYQPQIIMNDGNDWDGGHYVKIAQDLNDGNTPSGASPYIYRMGTPALVHLLSPGDIKSGFFWINFTANFLTVIFLFYFFKSFIENFYVLLLLMFLFMIHWLSVVRMLYFLPTFTDYCGVTFLTAGLLLIQKYRESGSVLLIAVISFVSFAGVFFREFVIAVPVALIFAGNPFSREKFFYFDFRKFISDKLVFLPLVFSVIGMMLVKSLVINTVKFPFLMTAIYYLYEKSTIQYLYGIFISVGPLLAIIIVFFRQAIDFLFENQYLMILIVCCMILGYTGGTHTERFFLWFSPVILLTIGVILQNNLKVFTKPILIFSYFITHALSSRMFMKALEPSTSGQWDLPVLTVIGEGNYLNLTSMSGSRMFLAVSFVQYILVFLLLIMLINHYKRRDAGISNMNVHNAG